MTGPQIQFIVRQINPVDLRVSSVKYDIQVSLAGPFELSTGPYVYKESRVTMVRADTLFKNTTINQTISYSGSFASNITDNFQDAAVYTLEDFYNRAEANANAYFANIYGASQSIKGYTGPIAFTGSGIYDSFYRAENN